MWRVLGLSYEGFLIAYVRVDNAIRVCVPVTRGPQTGPESNKNTCAQGKNNLGVHFPTSAVPNTNKPAAGGKKDTLSLQSAYIARQEIYTSRPLPHRCVQQQCAPVDGCTVATHSVNKSRHQDAWLWCPQHQQQVM